MLACRDDPAGQQHTILKHVAWPRRTAGRRLSQQLTCCPAAVVLPNLQVMTCGSYCTQSQLYCSALTRRTPETLRTPAALAGAHLPCQCVLQGVTSSCSCTEPEARRSGRLSFKYPADLQLASQITLMYFWTSHRCKPTHMQHECFADRSDRRLPAILCLAGQEVGRTATQLAQGIIPKHALQLHVARQACRGKEPYPLGKQRVALTSSHAP